MVQHFFFKLFSWNFSKKITNVAKFAKFCQISKISAWESGRFWKMLSNAYLLAKIGADTAENEQHFAENLPIGRRVADSPDCRKTSGVNVYRSLRGPHRGAVGPAGCTLRPQACRTPRAFNLRELKVPKWLFWQSSRQFVLRETSKVPRVHQMLLISDKVWQLRHISFILYVWYLLEVE